MFILLRGVDCVLLCLCCLRYKKTESQVYMYARDPGLIIIIPATGILQQNPPTVLVY